MWFHHLLIALLLIVGASSHAYAAPKGEKTKRVWLNGKPDAPSITNLISKHRTSLKGCYESGLKRDPELAGKLEIRFKITRFGRVGKTKVTADTMESAPFKRCVLRRLRTWRFPNTHKGGVMVEVPVNFKSLEEAGTPANVQTASLGQPQPRLPRGSVSKRAWFAFT